MESFFIKLEFRLVEENISKVGDVGFVWSIKDRVVFVNLERSYRYFRVWVLSLI